MNLAIFYKIWPRKSDVQRPIYFSFLLAVVSMTDFSLYAIQERYKKIKLKLIIDQS